MVETQVAAVTAGSRRAAGRLISRIENGDPRAESVMRALFPHTGAAHIVGVTGPPGAGKSTVVDELIRVIRQAGKSIGVIAVDPNSPFTGGAILGDRIRMMRHALDEHVFIRSMGARGNLGGLARTTGQAARVMDAMRFDIILIETVGVGQSELQVAEEADTTIVVIPPDSGDGVQVIKAGIMEIADIFVVNKADHPQANKIIGEIRDLMHMEPVIRPWPPPIVPTIALQGDGLQDVWMRILQHEDYLKTSGELERKRKRRLQSEVLDIVWRRLRERVVEPRVESESFSLDLARVVNRELDPYALAARLVSEISWAPQG